MRAAGALDGHSLATSQWAPTSRPEATELYLKRREKNRVWGRHNEATNHSWWHGREVQSRTFKGVWNKDEQVSEYFRSPIRREPGERFRRDLQRTTDWSPRGGTRLMSEEEAAAQQREEAEDAARAAMAHVDSGAESGVAAAAGNMGGKHTLSSEYSGSSAPTSNWWETAAATASPSKAQRRAAKRAAAAGESEHSVAAAVAAAADEPEPDLDGVTDGTAATLPGTDLGGGGRFFTFSLTADEMRDRDDPAVQLALRRRRRGAPPVKLSEFGDVALEAVEAAAMVSDSKKKKPGLLARLLGNKGPAGARMRRAARRAKAVDFIKAKTGGWWENAPVAPYTRPAITSLIEDTSANLALNVSAMSELNLSYKGLGHTELMMLYTPLTENTCLQELDLRGNSLGDEGAKTLGSILKLCDTIVVVRVGANEIGTVGGIALLGGNAVETLHLDENHVNEHDDTLTPKFWSSVLATSTGMKRVGKALRYNTSVQHLSLSKQGIGDMGVHLLAKGLKKNTTMQALDLSNNAIQDHGATYLAEVLVAQPTYLSLSLNNNRVGDRGCKQLRRAIRRNRDMYLLDLAYNKISKLALEEINATLSLNVKEQVFRKNVYGRYAPRRLERPNIAQFQTTDDIKNVKVMGHHVANPMDDLVAEYLISEGTLPRGAILPEVAAERDAAVAARRHFVPSKHGASQAHNYTKNFKKVDAVFGTVGANGTRLPPPKKVGAFDKQNVWGSPEKDRSNRAELLTLQRKLTAMKARGRTHAHGDYQAECQRLVELQGLIGHTRFQADDTNPGAGAMLGRAVEKEEATRVHDYEVEQLFTEEKDPDSKKYIEPPVMETPIAWDRDRDPAQLKRQISVDSERIKKDDAKDRKRLR